MIRKAALMLVVAATALAGSSAAGGAEAPRDYASDLGRVYGAYQNMLALKEACDARMPKTRAANGKAFAAWQAQHRPLVQDLQRRVNAMLLKASKDKDDYVRNVGKYEGDILLARKDYRDTLLALGPDDLRAQCQRMPEMLKGPVADLEQVYAVELQTIRRRK